MPSAHSDQSPLAFPIISCHYLFISFLLSPHVSLKLGFCCISWDPFDLWTQPWQMHSIDSVRRKTLHIGSPIVWSLDQEFVEQYQQCISSPPFNLNNTSYHLLKWVFGVLTETWACSRFPSLPWLNCEKWRQSWDKHRKLPFQPCLSFQTWLPPPGKGQKNAKNWHTRYARW